MIRTSRCSSAAGLLFSLSLATLSTQALAEVMLNPIVASVVGPESHVPVALQNARWSMLNPDINVLTFQSMDRLFTTRTVPHAGQPSALQWAKHPLDFRYSFEKAQYTPEQFLDRTYTNALMVIKDGKIVHESYRHNSGPGTRFVGWSMTKSLVSLMIGSALEQGLIKSLDDNITRYLPELKAGAYRDVTIRQILQMRSGVDYDENYDFSQPGIAARNHINSLVKNVTRFVDPAIKINRKHPPGEVFEYKTIDTAVLGLLIERVSGTTLASFMAEHLWEPLGAEADGFFILDGEPGVGREFSGAGYNAVMRDYARVGLMMLNEGRFNDRQIVSPAWVKQTTKPVGDEKRMLDYGYQWWTYSGTASYAAMGLQGQFIYVDPPTRTVVVKMSFFPPVDPNDAYLRESWAFFRAVSAWQPK